jgi:hypothetical protein
MKFRTPEGTEEIQKPKRALQHYSYLFQLFQKNYHLTKQPVCRIITDKIDRFQLEDE